MTELVAAAVAAGTVAVLAWLRFRVRGEPEGPDVALPEDVLVALYARLVRCGVVGELHPDASRDRNARVRLLSELRRRAGDRSLYVHSAEGGMVGTCYRAVSARQPNGAGYPTTASPLHALVSALEVASAARK